MLSFPAAVRVFVCLEPTDMRRSFDGLAAMVEQIIQADPFASGHLFIFRNRRGNSLKILYWDRDGWAIWYKRLEAGTFQFPFADTGRRTDGGVAEEPGRHGNLVHVIELGSTDPLLQRWRPGYR